MSMIARTGQARGQKANALRVDSMFKRASPSDKSARRRLAPDGIALAGTHFRPISRGSRRTAIHYKARAVDMAAVAAVESFDG
jgi:hypothetical protein